MAEEKHLQPNNLFSDVKKGKSFHRRTKSTNDYDFGTMLNIPRSNPGLMEEIAKDLGVADTNATRKAISAASKKQGEKHVIIEDINEIPKNIGWLVPKNHNAGSNPLQMVTKHNLKSPSGQVQPAKKLEKFQDQGLVNDLTGLNVILERHQSVESSDFDAIEMTPEKSAFSPNRKKHSRTISWNEPSLSTKKQMAEAAHNNPPLKTLPSPQSKSRVHTTMSIDFNNRTSEPAKKELLRKSQPQFHPHRSTQSFEPKASNYQSGSLSTKVPIERFDLAKNITPDMAKNFLKVLERHKKSPSVGGSSVFADHRKVSQREQLTESKYISQRTEPTVEKSHTMNYLEEKMAKMSLQLEQLNSKTSMLSQQVVELTGTVNMLRAENDNLKKVT